MAVNEGEEKVQLVGREKVERLLREASKACPAISVPTAVEDGVPPMGKGGDLLCASEMAVLRRCSLHIAQQECVHGEHTACIP